MTTYQCKMCSFIFDEEKENMDSEEHISWENLDPKWECPDCGTLRKDEDM